MSMMKRPSRTELLFSRLLLCSAVAATLSYQTAQAEVPQSLMPYSFATTPGRLPKNVIPTDYVVDITPDTAKATIKGSQTVSLNFLEATDRIQFNSLNQALSNVKLDGKPVKSVTSDDKEQLTTVLLPAAAKAGKHTLSFSFTAKIESEPHGMFLQEYVNPDGSKDKLITTKFEATDARRMFPCWDEPAFRATYQLTITAPAAWTAIGNMPVASRKVHGALATTSFERSPKMPTYLVHVSAGNFGQISGSSQGTKLYITAAKGQEQNGKEALANATQILADYNDYFGMTFPLPKLDSIAVPGGFQGGMENWGAITYTDQALLLTPSSTKGAHQMVYAIQAHEMAHQWFGDLVTMGWWDELWLNESFASWRAAKETDLRNPDWHWWEGQDGAKESAMAADANLTSHPILQHVTNEQEASSAFDPSITYDKGQSVLRMLEAYLGPDVFRDGIRQYMKAHAYSNTTSGDLWKALSDASGKNVNEIIGSWTTQAGFPLVSVQSSCDASGKRSLTFSQQRFVARGVDSSNPHWNVPLQLRVGNGKPTSVLLTRDGQTEPAGTCNDALSVNADTVGYYRVAYDDATTKTNLAHFAAMSDADRIGLLDDQWALVKAGKKDIAGFFDLAAAMGTTQNLRSWEIITEALGTIEHAERGTPGYAAFTNYARSIIKPLANQLGWDAKDSESPGIQRLRRSVLSDLGAWGDADVIAEARARFAAFVKDRNAIPTDSQSFILSIVSQNATDAEYEQMHEIARSAKNHMELLNRYYPVMMLVRSPDLANKSAQLVLSDEIPQQAEALRIQLALMLSEHNPNLSWDVFTKNYDRLIAPLMPEGTTIMTQITPDVFWNSVPLDQIESWMKSKSPAELAPFIARGMEGAHTKLAEKTLLTQATDAYLKTKAVASK